MVSDQVNIGGADGISRDGISRSVLLHEILNLKFTSTDLENLFLPPR